MTEQEKDIGSVRDNSVNERPSIFLMLLRATYVFGPAAIWLGLFFALEIWPESPWARTWQVAWIILSIAAFVTFFATRQNRVRRR